MEILGCNRLRSVFTLQMSWQEYVEKNLVGTGKVCKAAIVSLDGSVLAQTAGLNALLPPHHSPPLSLLPSLQAAHLLSVPIPSALCGCRFVTPCSSGCVVNHARVDDCAAADEQRRDPGHW